MELKTVKQLFSKRSEFLRILYMHEGAQGNLCRAIASWVTSQLQESHGTDIVSSLEEIQATVATCYQRGAGVRALMEVVCMLNCRATVLKVNSEWRKICWRAAT